MALCWWVVGQGTLVSTCRTHHWARESGIQNMYYIYRVKNLSAKKDLTWYIKQGLWNLKLIIYKAGLMVNLCRTPSAARLCCSTHSLVFSATEDDPLLNIQNQWATSQNENKVKHLTQTESYDGKMGCGWCEGWGIRGGVMSLYLGCSLEKLSIHTAGGGCTWAIYQFTLTVLIRTLTRKHTN